MPDQTTTPKTVTSHVIVDRALMDRVGMIMAEVAVRSITVIETANTRLPAPVLYMQIGEVMWPIIASLLTIYEKTAGSRPQAINLLAKDMAALTIASGKSLTPEIESLLSMLDQVSGGDK